uniref:malate dehydrogenase n=1 Tax=Dictyopteris undulata TaxID=156997 RepID=A0A097IUK3_9PHAE|nr:malate dehydrogenase [Dictyopteris undulata]
MVVLQVVVTGGAGQIAYSLIPLIARGLVFGPATRVHLRLLDIPPAAQALEAIVMEIQDSLFPTALEGVLGTTDEVRAFEGAQVAILLGGFPRKPGMERGQLMAKNVGIMKRMGQLLERHASRDCKALVVANPAATNCLVLAANAPSLPRKNFSFLSRLDHERMVGMLLEKANSVLAAGTASHAVRSERLRPADVRGLCIWGNHSDSQVPDASSVEFCLNGNWVPAQTILGDSPWLKLQDANAVAGAGGGDYLSEAVRNRGAVILAARKLSSAMSAANATAAHLGDWLCSPPTGKTVSMGVFSDGNPFGVPEGLVCSFPVQCGDLSGANRGGWNFDSDFRLTEDVSRQLAVSVAELEEEREMAFSILNGGQSTPSEGPPSSAPVVVSTATANGTGNGTLGRAANGAVNISKKPISSL